MIVVLGTFVQVSCLWNKNDSCTWNIWLGVLLVEKEQQLYLEHLVTHVVRGTRITIIPGISGQACCSLNKNGGCTLNTSSDMLFVEQER